MSTQLSTSRRLDASAVQNIIAKRKLIKVSDAGQLVKVYIASNGGTTLPVTTKEGEQVMGANGAPLMKTIYNVNANSQIAMLNLRNHEILKQAMQAETAGNVDEAHTLFNQYLNSIQVSFNVLLTGSNPVTFGRNDLIKGTVQLITTDNGQLLTLDKVSAVEARELSDTPKFTLSELMGITEDLQPGDVFTSAEQGDKVEAGANAQP